MNAYDLIEAAKGKIAFNGLDLFSAVDPDSLAMATAYAAIAQAEAAQRQADALEKIAAVMEANRDDVERKYYRQELRAALDLDEDF